MRDRSRSPFPGMDPYLERFWPDVHHRICTYACDQLRPRLPAGLIPRLDERTIIETDDGRDRVFVPDIRVVQHGRPEQRPEYAPVALAEPLVISVRAEPIVEGFIKVIDTRNDARVVTVIEFASPANKGTTDGRRQYAEKQRELLSGGVNLVEVDLLRSGKWNSWAAAGDIPAGYRTPYHACVTRGSDPGQPELYPIRLREPLPAIRVPLRPTDRDVALELQPLIDLIYLNGSYGYDIDYAQPPAPPLDGDDATWARERAAMPDPI